MERTFVLGDIHGNFKTSLNPDDVPVSHKVFFENQKIYHIENNNCYVHGGFNRFQPFEGQTNSTYFWDRILWQEALQWQIDQK